MLLWILVAAIGVFLLFGGTAMVATAVLQNRASTHFLTGVTSLEHATDSINQTIELMRQAGDRHAALRTAETNVLHDLIVDMETQLRYVATNLAEEAGIAGKSFHGVQQLPVLPAEPTPKSHRAMDLADLCRYYGLPDSEQRALFSWLNDPAGTVYTLEQADEMYQWWCDDQKRIETEQP